MLQMGKLRQERGQDRSSVFMPRCPLICSSCHLQLSSTLLPLRPHPAPPTPPMPVRGLQLCLPVYSVVLNSAHGVHTLLSTSLIPKAP